MTLVELLVAFMILLMLVGALVALTTRSLETWSTGETRKDMYDRAQVVLDSIVRDLRNTYLENEVFEDGRRELQVPLFACDQDRVKQQRLRFVRTGNPAVMASGGAVNRPRYVMPIMYYGDFWEVAYVLDPDPAKSILWRGQRYFDRQPTENLLRPADYDDPSRPLFTQCFRPVETGILHVGFKFWTQYTTTWDESVPITHVMAGSKQKSGPETIWDSTRIDKRFKLHRNLDRTNIDFVYPQIVQITVQVEAGSPETSGIRLAEQIDDRNSILRLTHTRGLPDAPAMVRLESEWVEYGGKTLQELTEVRRGRRGTAATSHAVQTPVRFGEVFTTEVRIPAYREAQTP
jgi:hypothetical protein